MNFIWDIALNGQKNKIFLKDIFFSPAENPSPCYEQAFSTINQKNVDDPRVEINPLMRFSEIFQYLLHPDVFYYLEKENQQFILYAFDVLVHILTEIDLCHGMTRREFYVRQIRREMIAGDFGVEAAKSFDKLSYEEQLAVADEMLVVIITGSSFGSFCRILKQIFPGVFIYQVKKHPQVVYVYLGKKKNVILEKKWQLVMDSFLPLDMEVKVFWDVHFGILDVDATMNMDAIAIF